MNKYKVRYSIFTEYEAETDEEADKIDEVYLNAIFKDGLVITGFKLEKEIIDDVDKNTEQTEDH